MKTICLIMYSCTNKQIVKVFRMEILLAVKLDYVQQLKFVDKCVFSSLSCIKSLFNPTELRIKHQFVLSFKEVRLKVK